MSYQRDRLQSLRYLAAGTHAWWTHLQCISKNDEISGQGSKNETLAEYGQVNEGVDLSLLAVAANAVADTGLYRWLHGFLNAGSHWNKNLGLRVQHEAIVELELD